MEVGAPVSLRTGRERLDARSRPDEPAEEAVGRARVGRAHQAAVLDPHDPPVTVDRVRVHEAPERERVHPRVDGAQERLGHRERRLERRGPRGVAEAPAVVEGPDLGGPEGLAARPAVARDLGGVLVDRVADRGRHLAMRRVAGQVVERQPVVVDGIGVHEGVDVDAPRRHLQDRPALGLVGVAADQAHAVARDPCRVECLPHLAVHLDVVDVRVGAALRHLVDAVGHGLVDGVEEAHRLEPALEADVPQERLHELPRVRAIVGRPELVHAPVPRQAVAGHAGPLVPRRQEKRVEQDRAPARGGPARDEVEPPQVDGVGHDPAVLVHVRVRRDAEADEPRPQAVELAEDELPGGLVPERRVAAVDERVVLGRVRVRAAHAEVVEPVEADAGAEAPRLPHGLDPFAHCSPPPRADPTRWRGSPRASRGGAWGPRGAPPARAEVEVRAGRASRAPHGTHPLAPRSPAGPRPRPRGSCACTSCTSRAPWSTKTALPPKNWSATIATVPSAAARTGVPASTE